MINKFSKKSNLVHKYYTVPDFIEYVNVESYGLRYENNPYGVITV